MAFSAPTPGRVVPVDLAQRGGTIIGQKDAFLCAARGTNVTIAFTRRIGAGFFGGEGFIMQRIEGDGLAFLHASGTLVTIDLAPGEQLRVDSVRSSAAAFCVEAFEAGAFCASTLGVSMTSVAAAPSAIRRMEITSLHVLRVLLL